MPDLFERIPIAKMLRAMKDRLLAVLMLLGLMWPFLLLSGCQDKRDSPVGALSAPVTPVPRVHCLGLTDDGYQPLYIATGFSTAEVALSGEHTPREVAALRCMTRESEAIELLRDLEQRGSIAGQLYALVGLRVLDQREFERLLPKYATNESTVPIISSGDVAVLRRVSDIAHEQKGTWYVQHFLPDLYPMVAVPEGRAEWSDDPVPDNGEPPSR